MTKMLFKRIGYQPSNVKPPIELIGEIVTLHKKGIITDAEFESLTRVIGAHFIENELELKIKKALEDKIYPHFSSEVTTIL